LCCFGATVARYSTALCVTKIGAGGTTNERPPHQEQGVVVPYVLEECTFFFLPAKLPPNTGRLEGYEQNRKERRESPPCPSTTTKFVVKCRGEPAPAIFLCYRSGSGLRRRRLDVSCRPARTTHLGPTFFLLLLRIRRRFFVSIFVLAPHFFFLLVLLFVVEWSTLFIPSPLAI
jgi:hypothetical protein